MLTDETNTGDEPPEDSDLISRVRAVARRIDERVKKALQDTDCDHTPLDRTDADVPPIPPSS